MSRHNNEGLPVNAKKVFNGQIFDVYQWEQELFDGTKATFEKLKRDDTGQVVAVTEDKKIIILHQEQPGKDKFQGIPGGRLDDGEDPLEGTKRELEEETGYVSDDWELYYKVVPFSKINWTVHCFVARGCKKVKEQNLDAGERIEIELVDFDKFIEIVLDDRFMDWEIKVKVMKAMISGKIDEFKKYLLG